MRKERTKRHYALGTYTELGGFPFGGFLSGRALCSDGRVRKLKRISAYADTWFSVPASVTVNGKTVSGFVTVETIEGRSVETEEDPSVLKFHANQYGKNAKELPRGVWKSSYLETEEGATKFLTRCSDSSGKHWSSGISWKPEDCPTCKGTNEAGFLKTPGSRYGRNSRECAPIAFAVARIVSDETGEAITEELLDSMMSLVVNNSEDPEYLIREYGSLYGFPASRYLEEL